MKSNQHNDILTININELNKIITSAAAEIINKPTIREKDFVDTVMHAIGRNHDAYVASMEEMHNSYNVLASLINTNVCNSLLGRPELVNDRCLMRGIVNIINNTIDSFSRETLKKFVTQDEWIEAYKEQQNNKPFSNHPWSQVKGFNPNTSTFNGFGVPNNGNPPPGFSHHTVPPEVEPNNGPIPLIPPYRPTGYSGHFSMPHGIFRPNPNPDYRQPQPGNPPGYNAFGFPSEPPKEMQDSLRAEFLNNRVVDLEKNLNDLGVMVIRLTEKLDLVPNKSTSAEKSFEKMNLEHFMNRLDGFGTYINDLGKAVHKLNKEMEILSKSPQESSDVAVTGFKEGGSHGLPEVNKEIEQPVGTAVEEEIGADGSVDNWASIESVRPDAEAYYNK
jgi:hypothetical protein